MGTIELDFHVLGYVFLFAMRLNKKCNDFGIESARLNSSLLLMLSGPFALFVSRLNIEVFMLAREKKNCLSLVRDYFSYRLRSRSEKILIESKC